MIAMPDITMHHNLYAFVTVSNALPTSSRTQTIRDVPGRYIIVYCMYYGRQKQSDFDWNSHQNYSISVHYHAVYTG